MPLTDLSQKAKHVLAKKDLLQTKARIVLAVDISGSMKPVFETRAAQQLLERILGISIHLDSDKSIEVYSFHEDGHKIGTATKDNYQDYVKNEFVCTKLLEGDTRYSPVMKKIVRATEPKRNWLQLFSKKEANETIPTIVFFITDGDNNDQDKFETKKLLTSISHKPIFWQFVGIGNERFKFLRSLDKMTGRFIDNAHFFSINDMESTSDDELYENLLDEFPRWLKDATEKQLFSDFS